MGIMGIKSVVCVASGDAPDTTALEACARLAARFQAHVEVAPVYADSAADLVYFGAALTSIDEAVRTRIAQAERQAQLRLETLAAEVAARYNLAADRFVIAERGLAPAAALAQAAALSDVVVFAGAGVRESAALGALFAETLLSARAPVLLAKTPDLELDAIALAWDGSIQSAHAARAALPLLVAAKRVVVLFNGDDEEADRGAADPSRLRALLERHGVSDLAFETVSGADVPGSLLHAANAHGCGVLAAGGYGRPRLLEIVLGGVTRALVRAPGSPSLLLAH